MLAVKDNRQYTITQTEAEGFCARGYDILDDDGNLVKQGTGKTVPYTKYQALLDEVEAFREEKPDKKSAKLAEELAATKAQLEAAAAEIAALKQG